MCMSRVAELWRKVDRRGDRMDDTEGRGAAGEGEQEDEEDNTPPPAPPQPPLQLTEGDVSHVQQVAGRSLPRILLCEPDTDGDEGEVAGSVVTSQGHDLPSSRREREEEGGTARVHVARSVTSHVPVRVVSPPAPSLPGQRSTPSPQGE